MEIVLLSKTTCNIQLQQSMYCHKRNVSQILQGNTLWQSQDLKVTTAKVKGQMKVTPRCCTHTPITIAPT